MPTKEQHSEVCNQSELSQAPLNTIHQLKLALREQRIKHGVDYAIVHKQGDTRVICNEVWKESIEEEAKKLGLTINYWTIYRN